MKTTHECCPTCREREAERARFRAQWLNLCRDYLSAENDRANGRKILTDEAWAEWARETRQALLDDLDAIT